MAVGVGRTAGYVDPLRKGAAWQCLRCRLESPPGARFCSGCGAALEVACAACGQANPTGARFCNGCGRELRTDAAPSEPRADTPRHLAERILRTRSALAAARARGLVLGLAEGLSDESLRRPLSALAETFGR